MINFIKKYGWVIAAIVVILLLLDKCNSNPIKYIKGEPHVIYEEYNKDSVRTHWEKYSDSVITVKKSTIEPLTLIDTFYLGDGILVDTTPETPTELYTYQRSDSLMDETIFVRSGCKPESIWSEYEYKQLMIRDSVYARDSINESLIQKVRVNQLYFGGNATVAPGFNQVSMGLDFVHKRGWQVEAGVGYDLSNNNPMVTIGYKKLISFRRKK